MSTIHSSILSVFQQIFIERPPCTTRHCAHIRRAEMDWSLRLGGGHEQIKQVIPQGKAHRGHSGICTKGGFDLVREVKESFAGTLVE